LDKDPPRNNKLFNEQIQLLEAIGMDWHELYEAIPWEEHYQDLCRYKEQFGHAHVRWRDPERLVLANWAVGMRNKYMDRVNGKHSVITDEQIEKMERIGFAWNTGGTLKYNRDVLHDTEIVEKNENGRKDNDIAAAVEAEEQHQSLKEEQ